MEITKQQIIHTDVLIIGGGTTGCYAALTIREKVMQRSSSPRKPISNEAGA